MFLFFGKSGKGRPREPAWGVEGAEKSGSGGSDGGPEAKLVNQTDPCWGFVERDLLFNEKKTGHFHPGALSVQATRAATPCPASSPATQLLYISRYRFVGSIECETAKKKTV